MKIPLSRFQIIFFLTIVTFVALNNVLIESPRSNGATSRLQTNCDRIPLSPLQSRKQNTQIIVNNQQNVGKPSLVQIYSSESASLHLDRLKNCSQHPFAIHDDTSLGEFMGASTKIIFWKVLA